LANGGQAGVDAFAAAVQNGTIFDVVITDLGMPVLDGRRVAATIKHLSPTTPIIMITGWGQRMNQSGELPPNVDRLLSKPPKLREIRLVLSQLFRDH
jgi:CheY-like chemotaxis protein